MFMLMMLLMNWLTGQVFNDTIQFFSEMYSIWSHEIILMLGEHPKSEQNRMMIFRGC